MLNGATKMKKGQKNNYIPKYGKKKNGKMRRKKSVKLVEIKRENNGKK